jgi:hypothetical protein
MKFEIVPGYCRGFHVDSHVWSSGPSPLYRWLAMQITPNKPHARPPTLSPQWSTHFAFCGARRNNYNAKAPGISRDKACSEWTTQVNVLFLAGGVCISTTSATAERACTSETCRI